MFKKNMLAIYGLVEKTYRDMNIQKFCDILDIRRNFYYEYIAEDGGGNPEYLSSTLDGVVERICDNIRKELRISIHPKSLLLDDLSKFLETWFDPIRFLIESRAEYRPAKNGVADEVKRLRQRNNLTYHAVQQISRDLHPDDPSRWITDAYIHRIEYNKKGEADNVTPRKLLTLAEVFNIAPEQLLKLQGVIPTEVTLTSKRLVLAIRDEWLDENGLTADQLEGRLRSIIRATFPNLLVE